MRSYCEFYIDRRWIAAAGTATLPVVDPATEAPFAEIALAGAADVDAAVAAARLRRLCAHEPSGADRAAGSADREISQAS